MAGRPTHGTPARKTVNIAIAWADLSQYLTEAASRICFQRDLCSTVLRKEVVIVVRTGSLCCLTLSLCYLFQADYP